MGCENAYHRVIDRIFEGEDMGKGNIRITHRLIEQALGFPIDWRIENIEPFIDEFGTKRLGESEMLISGKDFPETNNRGEAENVKLICHKENITFEVKKRKREE